MKNFKVLKRILIVFLCIVLCTVVIFMGFNKPRYVKADILSIAALGGGALATVVAAYFATSGIVLEGSAGSNGSDFLGNYVANYVVNSPSFVNNQYFDTSGNWIGSAEQLSMVQNTENGVVSFIFGKDFAAWLNVLTQAFVADNELAVGNSTVLVNDSGVSIDGISYPVYEYNATYPGLKGSIIPAAAGTYTFKLADNYYYRFTVSRNNANNGYTCAVASSADNVTYTNYSTGANLADSTGESFFRIVLATFVKFTNKKKYLCFGNANGSGTINVTWQNEVCLYDNYDLAEMSLEGALTDGYEDFQDAIEQDMEKEKDNAEAVFGINVGAYNPALSPDLIAEALLNSILTGEYTGEYTGSYEDQEEAEEELQEEQEFVPEVPDGWVIVNGLEDFFPFCIPFDFISVIQQFNASPEAPVIDWEMGFGGVFEAETIHLDFSDFDAAARIFRICVLIGFLIFLILKTRDLIRG